MSKEYDIVFIPLGAASMGGAERSIAYLAKGMQQQGKRVLVVAERALENTYYPRFIEEHGLSIEWVDWSPETASIKNLVLAYRVFRRLRPRLVQFNISWRRNMWVIPLAARLARVSGLVGTMRGMPDPHTEIPRKKHLGIVPGLRLWHLPELLAGWMWAKTLHLTVSVNALDYPGRLARDYAFPPKRMIVVHNGVFRRTMPVTPGDRSRTRASIGIRENDCLLGYFGRWTWEKGIHVILSALDGLPSRYRLIIAGDGPYEPELRAQIERCGLGDRVQFLGFLDKPDDMMAACDMILVPSLWQEACSRVIVEAMNQGTPVIGTEVGGTPELIEHEKEGLIVQPHDIDGLRAAIERIGEEDGFREALSNRARARISKQFTMEQVVARYATAYAPFLNNTPLGATTEGPRAKA